MVGREGQERGAEQRVLPGREDLNPLLFSSDPEKDPRPLRAADPVLLHQPHALRPALEAADGVEQLFGEIGDAQEPLRQEPLLDDRTRSPAAAVDHLFIGEYGVLDRIPVDP